MSALYIDEQTAASLINMDDALKLVEESFSSYSEGKSFNMTRQRMRIRKGALHMLPGAVPYKGVIGFKAYTSFRAGLIFKVHLYDAENGSPLAIIDANEIGRLRTGAASGIASKYMSKKDTNTAFIFGGGFQAEAQLEAVHKTTPLKKVYAATRKIENAAAFAEKLADGLFNKGKIHYFILPLFSFSIFAARARPSIMASGLGVQPAMETSMGTYLSSGPTTE